MTAPSAAYAQAHHDAAPTEEAARARIAPKAGQLRARVLELVVAAGEWGLTASEAYEQYCDRWGEPVGGHASIAPRLSELERRGGWVEKSSHVRVRRIAYIATEAGRAWAASNTA